LRKINNTETCDECGIIRMPVIQVGEVNNPGSRTIFLCKRCVTKMFVELEYE